MLTYIWLDDFGDIFAEAIHAWKRFSKILSSLFRTNINEFPPYKSNCRYNYRIINKKQKYLPYQVRNRR